MEQDIMSHKRLSMAACNLATRLEEISQITGVAGPIYGHKWLPIQALDFPTTHATDNKLPMKAWHNAGDGGGFKTASGIIITMGIVNPDDKSLAREIQVKVDGVSEDKLPANTRFYIRGIITPTGHLKIYYDRGSESDPTPEFFVNEFIGKAGFDSTPVDILLGEIRTGANNTMPDLMIYSNNKILEYQSQTEHVVPPSLSYKGFYKHEIMWARKAHITYGMTAKTTDDFTIGALDHSLSSAPIEMHGIAIKTDRRKIVSFASCFHHSDSHPKSAWMLNLKLFA